VKVDSLSESDGKSSFDYPFLQLIASYLGEFIFTIMYYIYKAFLMQQDVKQSEIRFVQFFYPASCDLIANLLFIFGLSEILASLSMMTKALTLPIAAVFSQWSFVKINKHFGNMQIAALAGILVSCFLILLVTFNSQEEWFTEGHGKGYFALVLSACFQAFEITLENRFFLIEKDLTALGLQQKISLWKVTLLASLFVLGNIFPDVIGQVTGSTIDTLGTAFNDMNESTELYWLMLGVMFFNSLAANLGMQIIKAENSVFKQSTALLSVPSLWLWHVFYGDEKDVFNVPKMIA
jgi:hypothetical protein